MVDADTAGTSSAGRSLIDDECWIAIVNRHRSAENEFFYSVTTTGVYCRPDCPSRRPRREHVRRHATCEEAERAGFRPCRRCRPNEPSITERYTATVVAACRLIETAEEMPTLDALAEAVGMSRFHFHRIFKAITGCTPRAYAAAQRADRMREALTKPGTVTDAIYDAGFNSNGRFYATSAEILGMSPGTFRSGGPKETIRFAVGACSLGAILVAATVRGICAISLGDDPQALVCALEARFPSAELIGGDREFEALVARVVGFVETPALGLDLPLDIRGTAFQQRVWQALRDIPLGTTLSYRELAARIGSPAATRAVARACAANPIGVAIPCHRVIRADGTLASYRWGVERKRALLDREAASPPPPTTGGGSSCDG